MFRGAAALCFRSPMQNLPLTHRRYRTILTQLAVSLPFPTHPQIRIAQLSQSIPVFGLLKPFRPGSPLELEGFSPNILVGTVSELKRLAEQMDLGVVNLSGLDHAVVVLTRCGQAPLSDVTRVIFWQAFGVPVYEIFTGLDDTILGFECELHEGWHLVPKVSMAEFNGELLLEAAGVTGLRTALSGFLTRDECPCGRRGQRLLNMNPLRSADLDYRKLLAIA